MSLVPPRHEPVSRHISICARAQCSDPRRFHDLVEPCMLASCKPGKSTNLPFTDLRIAKGPEIEMEFTNKLLSGSRKFNLDLRALMRGDIMTQVQRNVSYWNIGVLSANDIRKDEGLDPILDPEADKYNKPMHMDTQQNDVTNGQQGDTQPAPAE